jgi:hypothetical protein
MRPPKLNLTERISLRQARHGQLDKLYARKELWESIQLPFQGSGEQLKRTTAKIRYYEKMLLRDRLVDGVSLVLDRKYDLTEEWARITSAFIVNRKSIENILGSNTSNEELRAYVPKTAEYMHNKLLFIAKGCNSLRTQDKRK